MKVYTRKEENGGTVVAVVFVLTLFAASVWIFFNAFTSGLSLVDILIFNGLALAFAVFFILTDIIVLFGSIYLWIKKPTESYKAKLTRKKADLLDGVLITRMRFSVEVEKEREDDPPTTSFHCYTIGDNSLIIGNYYVLKIGKQNRTPKSVEEINYAQMDGDNKIADKIPRTTQTSFGLRIPIAGSLITLLVSLVLGSIKYPQYAPIYIGIIIGGCLLFSWLKSLRNTKT